MIPSEILQNRGGFSQSSDRIRAVLEVASRILNGSRLIPNVVFQIPEGDSEIPHGIAKTRTVIASIPKVISEIAEVNSGSLIGVLVVTECGNVF